MLKPHGFFFICLENKAEMLCTEKKDDINSTLFTMKKKIQTLYFSPPFCNIKDSKQLLNYGKEASVSYLTLASKAVKD